MASEIIETKLVIEGEAEYRQSIKNCSEAIKTLKSELAAATSEYRNNATSMEALKAKGEVLTKMYDAQKQKLETIRGAFDNAKNVQDAYQKNIEECKKKIASLDQELNLTQASVADLAWEEANLSEQLSEQKQILSEAEAGNKLAAVAVNEHQQALNYALVQLNKFDDELTENVKQLEQIESQASQAAEGVEKLGEDAEKSSKATGELGEEGVKNVKELADILTRSKLPGYIENISKALLECMDSAAKFEYGMKETFTLLPNLTADAKQEMSEDMLQFSARMNVLTDEALPSLYNAISAGVPEENVFNFLETAQKAAVGGVTDLGTAVDSLTVITNAYSDQTQDAAKTADQMFTAVKLGKTNFGELSKSMCDIVPTAAEAGVSFGDLSAALATMTSQGVPTSSAATKLKQMLGELTDSGSEVAKTFEAVAGKSFSHFIQEGNSVQDALKLLEKYAMQAGLGTDKLFSSVEAGSSALLLTGGASDKFTEALTAMQHSAGAVDDAYGEMADSAEYQSKRLGVAFENLKTATGEALLPILSEVQSAGADALGWLTEFVEKNPIVVQVLTGAAAGIAALSVGLTGYKVAVELATIASEMFSVTMGPITIAVAAVGAALAVFIPLVSNFVSELQASDRRIEEMTESAAGLSEKINQSNTKFEENKSSIEKTSGVAEIYVHRLQDLETEMKNLEKQGGDTTKQQNEYKVLVERLNKEIPDLNAQIDEQTGLLKGGVQALQSQVEAWEELSLQRAYEEKYAEIYQAQAEAKLELQENEINLNEAIAEGNALKGEREEKEQKLAELLGVTTEHLNTYINLDEAAYLADAAHAEEARALAQEIFDLNFQLEGNAQKQSEYQEAIGVGNEALASATQEVEAAAQTWAGLKQEQQAAIDMTPEVENSCTSVQSSTDAMITKMNDLQAAYEQSYNRAYDSISGQMKLFKDYELDTSISVGGISKSLDDQIGFMANYSNNMRILSSWGIDQGLLKSLSDGSVESASILQAIVDGGQEKIKELNEKFGKVEDGKKEFASTVGEIETDFTEKMKETVKAAEDMAAGLDQWGPAYQSSINTMNGAIAGVRARYGALQTWYDNVKKLGMVGANAASVQGSYMAGLATVPFDGYIAELHKGERILTATQAKAQDIARSIAVPQPMAPRIARYVPNKLTANSDSAKSGFNLETVVQAVGSVVRDMLHGAEVILDEEKVGEFAVRKVTEEAFG